MMNLPEAMVAFAHKYPSIHVEMLMSNRMVDLVADGIDIAIRAAGSPTRRWSRAKVGSTAAGLFASKWYLDKRGRPKKVGDLAEHDCILFRGRAGKATWLLEGPKGQESVEVNALLGSDGLLVQRARDHRGHRHRDAAAVHGESLRRGRTGGRARVPEVHGRAVSPLHVVMPSASFVPARVAVVRDFLVEHLAKLLA